MDFSILIYWTSPFVIYGVSPRSVASDMSLNRLPTSQKWYEGTYELTYFIYENPDNDYFI